MSYAVAVTTEPVGEPITLAEARKHLRLSHGNEDANIEKIYIPAARKRIEGQISRQLMTATLTLSLEEFPHGNCPILIPRAPVQSVSSITYVDSAGARQTLASSNYVVETNYEPAEIRLGWNKTWPTVRKRTEASTVLVTFVAGYASRSAVPEGLKEAMLLLVSHYFYHREDVAIGGVPKAMVRAVDDLLSAHSFGDEFEVYS